MNYIIYKVLDINQFQTNIYFIKNTELNLKLFSYLHKIIDNIQEWYLTDEKSYTYEINLKNNLEYSDIQKFTQIEFTNYSYKIIDKDIISFDYDSINLNVKDKLKCKTLFKILGFNRIETFFEEKQETLLDPDSPSSSEFSDEITDSDYDDSDTPTDFFKIKIDNKKYFPPILQKFT